MDRKPLLFGISFGISRTCHVGRISRTVMMPALCLLLAGQGALADTTYRWVDDNGNTVLSDRPPPAGTPYTEVGVNTGLRRYPKPANAEQETTNDAARAASSAAEQRNTRAGSTETLGSVRVVQAEPALCEQARDNIFKLETFAQMRVQDDDGTVRFMTDEERARQLATAYQVRDANCTSD